MRLRVNDPALLSDLFAFFKAKRYTVPEQVGNNELEVAILGSPRTDAYRMDIYLLLRAWESGQAPGAVEIVG